MVVSRYIPTRIAARALMLRHCLAGRRLPPGPLVDLEREERRDRRYLLRSFDQYGPIFKALAWNDLWICILGLDRCTRLLQQHKDHLAPVTIDISRFVPKGFLRQMRGEDHRHYRRTLVKAIRGERPEALRADLEHIAEDELRRHAEADPAGSEADIAMLARISTAMLVTLFFGVQPGSPAFARIRDAYDELGPHGLVWNPGPRQAAAFQRLCAVLRDLLAGPEAPATGILRRIHDDNALDDTMLGNLIYTVEMGRYDTQGLFRWLVRYAGKHDAAISRIRAGMSETEAAGATRAFVLETLRMDQSERLVRRAERDITFDGYHIPQGSQIRLCLWEAHKDESAFPDAFRFDPGRFLQHPPSGEDFSPFGLDHHHCPLSDVAVAMSTAFLDALTRSFTIEILADGEPIRGAYHWEPSVDFTFRLRRRTG